MTAKPSYEELEKRVQELEKIESERNLTENLLKKIFDNTQDAIFIHDLEGKILDVNDKMCRMYRLTKDEALKVNIGDVSSSKMSMEILLERWQKVLNGEKLLFEWEALRPKEKTVLNVEVSIQKINYHDKDIILANVRDITERKRANEKLRHRLVYEQMLSQISNMAVQQEDLEQFLNDSLTILGETLDISRAYIFEYHHETDSLDNTVEWCASDEAPQKDALQNRQAETEREKLQTQLTQAQKMESVGRLAGGVAHDFNNMLGVIMGHAELALQKARNKQDPCSNMEKIQIAARRSADLTKQLLAFARKQIIEPKVLEGTLSCWRSVTTAAAWIRKFRKICLNRFSPPKISVKAPVSVWPPCMGS